MADNKKYLLEYSEWLDSEITQRYRTGQGQMRKQRGRNALSELPVATTETDYNGYFKLVDMTTTDENGVTTYKVGVVDGATYNAEAGTSGDSVIMLNGRQRTIPAAVFSPENLTEEYYIVLEFVWSTGEATLIQTTSLPAEDDSILYLQIGRYFVKDGNLQIEQWAMESGAYSLRNEYAGDFKLYRTPGEGGVSVAMAEGYSDAAGRIAGTAIDWTGGVYVNFRADGDKITASVENDRASGEGAVSVHIGTVKSDKTVSQVQKNEIVLAGKYVV